MAENVTIKLAAPIVMPGEGTAVEVHEVVLREPRFNDIMTLGEPAAFARTADGMIYTAEKDETIRAYIERLLVEPKNPLLLAQLGAADTFKLLEAVHGFFEAARATI